METPTTEQVIADRRHMARALELADYGRFTADPNPRVGCVIVRDGREVGAGLHWKAGEPHAEVNALQAAGEAARGATAYVTLEPCSHHGRTPPCTDALIAAGVARVVIAMQDPNPQVCGGGIEALRAADIPVHSGVLEAEARALNPGFVQRMEQGRPWVRVKLAASLDGRTAMASGESQWITGEVARRDVQLWRARAGAILTGSGTVVGDDPRLNVRMKPFDLAAHAGFPDDPHYQNLPARQPLRVILDARLRTPPGAQILRESPVWILTEPEVADSPAADALRGKGAEVRAVPLAEESAEGGLDLGAVLSELARAEINELHVESGPGLAGALARGGWVDEWLIYQAPLLLGSSARPLVEWPLTRMSERAELEIVDTRWVGETLRLRAYPRP
ncbi:MULTISPECIES: bifunctional diaminohydroxyphosphoribosylaminopyrimidine deaminase/5-amino-6-(5-phosphoribosylamino)uracil reductase RibD [unclassified Thioalkalivibrio]|uniref:bifunctional diaminohydroxyphosphoribosylaminopyrimidine deaminase/5-amino-6-(5-phosphoribosylamino)uracil reductase RibD n=1 Tax=unclassified Thioalkalivibrio TaxID=2621013 RepID=UPI0003694872|nr:MULTISPECIES: bifunctional diaminohydroxyphosphoribosylaminopyrimidine deaminase/5-amino-6-(5-phosphoribosylamino)uracil reductase RibD [unclassified Thioalkalivibrio]